jgi:glucan-binding YG repeat protein
LFFLSNAQTKKKKKKTFWGGSSSPISTSNPTLVTTTVTTERKKNKNQNKKKFTQKKFDDRFLSLKPPSQRLRRFVSGSRRPFLIPSQNAPKRIPQPQTKKKTKTTQPTQHARKKKEKKAKKERDEDAEIGAVLQPHPPSSTSRSKIAGGLGHDETRLVLRLQETFPTGSLTQNLQWFFLHATALCSQTRFRAKCNDELHQINRNVSNVFFFFFAFFSFLN